MNILLFINNWSKLIPKSKALMHLHLFICLLAVNSNDLNELSARQFIMGNTHGMCVINSSVVWQIDLLLSCDSFKDYKPKVQEQIAKCPLILYLSVGNYKKYIYLKDVRLLHILSYSDSNIRNSKCWICF